MPLGLVQAMMSAIALNIMAKNKVLILAFICLVVSSNTYGKKMNKYEWLASECAPDGFTMQIVSGVFLLKDSSTAPIPSRKSINNGWGKGRSIDLIGPKIKSLPHAMKITYFSYTEDKFYSGEFDLPYEKILTLFQAGYDSPRDGEKLTYDEITAGVAPGGEVSVWLIGIDRRTEVFFGRAKEDKNIEWKVINDNPEYPRERYIELVVDESITNDEKKLLKLHGVPIGRWESYHKRRYTWTPLFTDMEVRNNQIYPILYFNGEEDYLYLPHNEKLKKNDRAVPSEMRFTWVRGGGNALVLRLYFEEKEIFEAFEKLGGKQQEFYLEFRRKMEEGKENIYFVVKNKEEEIFLRHTKVKTFAPPD